MAEPKTPSIYPTYFPSRASSDAVYFLTISSEVGFFVSGVLLPGVGFDGFSFAASSVIISLKPPHGLFHSFSIACFFLLGEITQVTVEILCLFPLQISA